MLLSSPAIPYWFLVVFIHWPWAYALDPPHFFFPAATGNPFQASFGGLPSPPHACVLFFFLGFPLLFFPPPHYFLFSSVESYNPDPAPPFFRSLSPPRPNDALRAQVLVSVRVSFNDARAALRPKIIVNTVSAPRDFFPVPHHLTTFFFARWQNTTPRSCHNSFARAFLLFPLVVPILLYQPLHLSEYQYVVYV